MTTPMLRIEALRAGYDGSTVLDGLALDVHEGTVTAVLGRNGVGKSTLVSSIVGWVAQCSGSIRFNGDELIGLSTDRIAARGIGLVPQGRRVFAPLSVEENLRIGVRARGENRWTVDRVVELLPRLGERMGNRGDQLSGGEQQMLAIGRALVGNPDLLLLDEPSDGLSPMVVETVTDVLRQLAAEGQTVLVVEQNMRMALALADSVAVIAKGEIAWQTTPDGFRADPDRVRSLMSVAASGRDEPIHRS